MADYTKKSGDNLPTIQATFVDADGTNPDITGSTVLLLVKPSGGSVVSFTATLVTPVSGVVSYTWLDGELNTPGNYSAEWEVTLVGGQVITYPNNGRFSIKVVDDLN